MNTKITKSIVNWGAIKRNLLIRDSGLDSRFTSKTIKDKRKESSKTACRGKFNPE